MIEWKGNRERHPSIAASASLLSLSTILSYRCSFLFFTKNNFGRSRKRVVNEITEKVIFGVWTSKRPVFRDNIPRRAERNYNSTNFRVHFRTSRARVSHMVRKLSVPGLSCYEYYKKLRRGLCSPGGPAISTTIIYEQASKRTTGNGWLTSSARFTRSA